MQVKGSATSSRRGCNDSADLFNQMVQHRFYVLFALAIAYPQLTATPVGIFIFFLTEQEFDPAILN